VKCHWHTPFRPWCWACCWNPCRQGPAVSHTHRHTGVHTHTHTQTDTSEASEEVHAPSPRPEQAHFPHYTPGPSCVCNASMMRTFESWLLTFVSFVVNVSSHDPADATGCVVHAYAQRRAHAHTHARTHTHTQGQTSIGLDGRVVIGSGSFIAHTTHTQTHTHEYTQRRTFVKHHCTHLCVLGVGLVVRRHSRVGGRARGSDRLCRTRIHTQANTGTHARTHAHGQTSIRDTLE
jgi:hypothetical protein